VNRSLEVLSKRTLSTTVHQFVHRLDASGGFAMSGSNDPAALARDCTIFSLYLNSTVHPVIDVQDGAAALTAAVDFHESL
jgi:uncharacterized protein DUF3303